MMLFDQKKLRARCNKQYDDIKKRARPRHWRSGRRKGHVRVPGLESLPFTKEQLWQRALEQVGTGVRQCPYCVAIGRPANLIDLSNFVWDHFEPIARVGLLAHTLENLHACCADCNNCKGYLTYDFFIGLMAAIEEWPDQRDRTNMHMCLRTHGVTMRMRFPGKPKEAVVSVPEAPSTIALALKEDW